MKYVNAAMEGNWFYIHRRAIGVVSCLNEVPIDMASLIYAQLHGHEDFVSSNCQALKDWVALCEKYSNDDEVCLDDLIFNAEPDENVKKETKLIVGRDEVGKYIIKGIVEETAAKQKMCEKAEELKRQATFQKEIDKIDHS